MGEESKDPIPYDRFQEVVKQKNDLSAELKKLQESAQAWDTAKATYEKNIGEAKTAYEKTVAEKESALSASQYDALRLRTAYATGLPLDLADRLQGKDATELKSDAERMKQFLKPASDGVPPPAGGGAAPPLDLKTMTPAEIRKARAEGKIKLGQ